MENTINVEELRAQIFEDGKVTKEEVLDLWKTKDSCNGATTVEFDELFAEAVMAWLMADGKIDAEEAQFLIDKIGEDGEIDDAEEELLYQISDYIVDGGEVPQTLIDAFPEYLAAEEPEIDED